MPASWNRNRLTEKLGIDYPIIQGPLGGLSSQRLTAAVSNFGGLGSFGAHGLAPEAIKDVIAQIRSLTSKPFAMNLWVSMEDEGARTSDESGFNRSLAPLAVHLAALGAPRPAYKPYSPARFEDQARVLLDANVPAFSFICGVPPREILEECRAKSIVTIGTATTPDEAAVLQDAGVNAIVASGFEAGGHRGSFLRSAEDSLDGHVLTRPSDRRHCSSRSFARKIGNSPPRCGPETPAGFQGSNDSRAEPTGTIRPQSTASPKRWACRPRVACAAAITHHETSHQRGTSEDSGCECDDLGRIFGRTRVAAIIYEMIITAPTLRFSDPSLGTVSFGLLACCKYCNVIDIVAESRLQPSLRSSLRGWRPEPGGNPTAARQDRSEQGEKFLFRSLDASSTERLAGRYHPIPENGPSLCFKRLHKP